VEQINDKEVKMRTALIKRVLPVMRIVCRRNRLGLLGMFIIIGIALVAVLAPQIAPYSPTQFQATERLKPPSLEHLFGTDVNGRDIFSRVVYGSRISLEASGVSGISQINPFQTTFSLIYHGRLSSCLDALDRVILMSIDSPFRRFECQKF